MCDSCNVQFEKSISIKFKHDVYFDGQVNIEGQGDLIAKHDDVLTYVYDDTDRHYVCDTLHAFDQLINRVTACTLLNYLILDEQHSDIDVCHIVNTDNKQIMNVFCDCCDDVVNFAD